MGSWHAHLGSASLYRPRCALATVRLLRDRDGLRCRVFELGPRARTIFAAIWIAGQSALVLTAGRRSDAAFGFRMFSESSTIVISLSREVEAPSGHGTTQVHVEDGAWLARDAHGIMHRFNWFDRVKEPGLASFDVAIHASYGALAQLERLQAALDDVAAHVPEDAETRRLVLDVVVRKNGREPMRVQLTSAPFRPEVAR